MKVVFYAHQLLQVQELKDLLLTWHAVWIKKFKIKVVVTKLLNVESAFYKKLCNHGIEVINVGDKNYLVKVFQIIFL